MVAKGEWGGVGGKGGLEDGREGEARGGGACARSGAPRSR